MNDSFEYDVALSYAGEDRSYVKQVASSLDYRGIGVFYDEMKKAELWGEDLYDAFDQIYRSKSRLVLMFVSAHYAAKAWPNHERKSAQARDLEEDGPYILPVRIDDTEVPGLRPTVGFVDSRTTSLYELVDLVIAKLGSLSVDGDDGGIGWEYMLLVEELESGLAATAEAKRDFVVGVANASGDVISDDDAPEDLSRRLRQSLKIGNNIERILTETNVNAAVGAPGEPGDAVLIRHLAARLTDVYSGLLGWASSLRGALVSDEMQPMYWALSNYVRGPIRQYEDWVADLAAKIRPLLESVRGGVELAEPVQLTFTLAFDIDPDDVAGYARAKAECPLWE